MFMRWSRNACTLVLFLLFVLHLAFWEMWFFCGLSSVLDHSRSVGAGAAIHNNLKGFAVSQQQQGSQRGSHLEADKDLNVAIRERYLNTVMMGLLGGLTYAAHLDPNRGGTTDGAVRNQCLTTDWATGQSKDFCIIKWDGYERLIRVKDLYQKVRVEGVEGDLMECGVWRGGITIMYAALLEAYGDKSRKVWVSDSFEGVPDEEQQMNHPDYDKVPETERKIDIRHWGGHVFEKVATSAKTVEKNLLTVEQEAVLANFQRFDLYDEDRIKFVKGYFSDSLPNITEKRGLKKLAILRVDGDLYSSTMDVLVHLYPLVSSGGYIVLDDYPLPASMRATHDFFDHQGLDRSLIKTDRITAEDRPAKFGNSQINRYAYFKKP